MNRSIGVLLFGVIGLAVLAVWLGEPRTPKPDETPRKTAAPAAPIVAAEKLRVRLANFAGDPGDLLDPKAGPWQTAQTTHVLLNRTPRVYQTEKVRPALPMTLAVQALRTADHLVFRLNWKDATRNAPTAPPRWPGREGVPARLNKQPTGQTNAFADAVAIMVPESYPGGDFPALVMGDKHQSVRIAYWNASRGASQLSASGRTHVESSGKTFRHQAHHADGEWTVTLELPGQATPSPIAFAVWDGEQADRDGLKLFSIWYVLE